MDDHRHARHVDGDIVDTIPWDATGPGLVGEESAELPVAVGPLPAVEFLTFPTIQTYDDGEIVRWIEPAPAGEPEPELPVPTLAITAAAPGDTTAPTEPDRDRARRRRSRPRQRPTEPATSADRRRRRAHVDRGHRSDTPPHRDDRGQPTADDGRRR